MDFTTGKEENHEGWMTEGGRGGEAKKEEEGDGRKGEDHGGREEGGEREEERKEKESESKSSREGELLLSLVQRL